MKNRNRKNKIIGHFVALPDSMTKSKVWEKLSCKAVWVYIEFKKKSKRDDDDNLSLTYSEVKYKMAPGTFSGAIKELIQWGFIEIIRPGGLFRRCTIYGLSDKWKTINIGKTSNSPTPSLNLPQKNTIDWQDIDRSSINGIETNKKDTEQCQKMELLESKSD